ncbi:MAG: aconitate hydratase [Elusimicrobia bacterium RIFOXYA2_FULL_39_19]|nr:MAG: aconitate hydratase [Elusimicrobia bacterium RIFOXYA2_FULL_39_19]
MNLTEKILLNHLTYKKQPLTAGEKISINIDQTLTQDATGTLVYLQLEALGISKIKTKLSVSYVDHNTLQTGFENSDDHRYLASVAKKYGIIFSPPGNGICHQLHLENFARPGETLLGSDSHTPTSSAMGMIAIGAGGLDIACAIAGEPYFITMPQVVNVVLTGRLKPWVSAKDIILELLRKFTVKGGTNKVYEYTGDALKYLSVPQRATITNMGAELGLTTSIFPSDNVTRGFLASQGRAKDWKELKPDFDAEYSGVVEIDLSKLEPMIACPHNPDNVKKVSELKGTKVHQVCIGSCTNSSYRDLLIVASVLKNKKINTDVDFIISPGSKQVMAQLAKSGALETLVKSRARILESTCGPCIGMGSAPNSQGVSLRTFNRNFAGRSGTKSAFVYLCSPETAIAAAIAGEITDPRKLGKLPALSIPKIFDYKPNFVFPKKNDSKTEIERGPNIKPLPEFTPLHQEINCSVVIKLKDNISTDDILPAGAKILPLRSNIPAISEYTLTRVDETFPKRAKEVKCGMIVAGDNYGQGSSREHAAITLRYLGIAVVLAKSFARIHRSNLINFGVLPVTFKNADDYEKISQLDDIQIENVIEFIKHKKPLILKNRAVNMAIEAVYNFDKRDTEMLLAGGLLPMIRNKNK